MRERHFPRVCTSCRAPMARQEDACWRCGTQWASEDEPRTTLTVIAGGAPAQEWAAPAIAVAAEAVASGR
jgi:predicted amidophosphoribosyltransferase